MRPDYLVHFLYMMPKKHEAKKIFDTLFPALLGVHLAREHSPDHVDKLHKYLNEAKTFDPARRRVLISQKGDKLKADLRASSLSNFMKM